MITPPADVHASLAGGAADLTTMITLNPDAPPFCSLVVDYDQFAETPRGFAQLAASSDAGALDGLVSWLNHVDEPTVTAHCFEYPEPFTGLYLTGSHGSTTIQIWTHPSGRELTSLWSAIGHRPEFGITVTLSCEVLRVAAESARDTDDATDDDASDEDASDEDADDDPDDDDAEELVIGPPTIVYDPRDDLDATEDDPDDDATAKNDATDAA